MNFEVAALEAGLKKRFCSAPSGLRQGRAFGRVLAYHLRDDPLTDLRLRNRARTSARLDFLCEPVGAQRAILHPGPSS